MTRFPSASASGPILSRRRFLAASGSAALMAGLAPAFPGVAHGAAAAPVRLAVEHRTLDVRGRAATVFGIRQPDGTSGLFLDPGRRFAVDLENRIGEPVIVHWHGQTPPYLLDGVADARRPLIAPGAVANYDFPARPGTHWMHSHHGLQEQRLLAAPLVVRTEDDLRRDEQEVTILLHDFTFRDPADVLAGLSGGHGTGSHAMAGHAMAGHEMGGHEMAGHAMPGHGASGTGSHAMAGHAMAGHEMGGHEMGGHEMAGHAMPGHGASGTGMAGHDLNDVEYDAYLANDRTLDDPQVVAVERGGRVRLRVINGASSTAFHLDLGDLDGTVVAVDGNPVRPLAGRRFPVSMGQRIDVTVSLPGTGAWPILALREGDRQRTGIVLATPGAAVARVAPAGGRAAPALSLGFEAALQAVEPLPARPVDLTLPVVLKGSMAGYVWSQEMPSATLRQGARVALEFRNMSPMAHPMHLHGHHFQVAAIDGRPVAGAVRDTVLVTPMSAVTVIFDADNPGRWPLHCHNLLHMAAGMMTDLVYEGTS